MGNVDFSKVSFFVLDEADRMLDMGFSEDIMTIAKKLPKTCQTIMFSATMPNKIEELAKTLLKNPVEIKLAVSKPAEKIKQEAYVCYEAQKLNIIKDIFKAGDLKRVIIFCGSKMKVKQLNAALTQQKINCGAMHSDLTQAERDDIMFKFKSGQIDVLVATDIVARGIDIDDITLVINFDVPHDTEDYVHRIGRTARADRDGRAITLVNEMDMYWFQQIEKFLEKVVEKMPLPEGCGEGPEYVKLNKPTKAGKNGKTSAKSRRQKDRDQTAHKRKPNNRNNRQEKAARPQGETDVQTNGNQPSNNGAQQGENQQANKNRQRNNARNKQRGNNQQGENKQGNRNAQGNRQKQGNRQNGNRPNDNRPNDNRQNGKNNGNSQRKNNAENVRPGSNGRGRGVAQKKSSDKTASRKPTPIVNPQKKENVVKKFIKRIFGFKK